MSDIDFSINMMRKCLHGTHRITLRLGEDCRLGTLSRTRLLHFDGVGLVLTLNTGFLGNNHVSCHSHHA